MTARPSQTAHVGSMPHMTRSSAAVESLCFHNLYKVVKKAYAKHLEFSSGVLDTTTEHMGKSLYAIFFTEEL